MIPSLAIPCEILFLWETFNLEAFSLMWEPRLTFSEIPPQEKQKCSVPEAEFTLENGLSCSIWQFLFISCGKKCVCAHAHTCIWGRERERERECESELIVYLSLFPLHPTSKALEIVFYHKPAQYQVLSLYTNTLFSAFCFSFLLSKLQWVFFGGGR